VLPGNPQHRDQPAPPRRDHEITFALQGITGDRTRALVFACETEITNGFSGPVPPGGPLTAGNEKDAVRQTAMACRFTVRIALGTWRSWTGKSSVSKPPDRETHRAG